MHEYCFSHEKYLNTVLFQSFTYNTEIDHFQLLFSPIWINQRCHPEVECACVSATNIALMVGFKSFYDPHPESPFRPSLL